MTVGIQGIGQPFIASLADMFRPVFDQIIAERASLGLLPLVTGDVLVGQEYNPQQMDVPRIVIVPIGCGYLGSSMTQNQPANPGAQGSYGQTPTYKSQYTRRMNFEAHFWGEDDTTVLGKTVGAIDAMYSFAATLELEREFLTALAAKMSIPTAAPVSSEWRQPQDVTRRGRLLVLSFYVNTPVTTAPYVKLPYSTVLGDGKVVQDVVVNPGDTEFVQPS